MNLFSEEQPIAPRPAKAKHVLHIGVDGLRPDCFPQAPGGAPNIIQRIGGQGTWTLERARTVLKTFSGPAWTSVVCGMSCERTGVLDNFWTPSWLGANRDITPVFGKDTPFPCILDVLKGQDKNIRTAMFYNWSFFKYIGNKGRPGCVDKEFYYNPKLSDEMNGDPYVVGNATEYLKNILVSSESSYTFIYLLDVDNTGHWQSGWCSDGWLEAVRTADLHVGQLLDIIDDLDMADEVGVILSADHGGKGIGPVAHGWERDEDLMIPMFIRGPGVQQNHEFEFEVANEDIAPTVTYFLGLDPSPWWTGRTMFEAFENN